MNRDITLDALQQEHISHLLRAWHSWASSDRVGTGYPGTAAGCSLYRASRQNDDWNGALDIAADIAEARVVDAVISRMVDPYRSALAFEARNLCSPGRVWRSARVDVESVEAVVADARLMLWHGLVKAGMA